MNLLHYICIYSDYLDQFVLGEELSFLIFLLQVSSFTL